MKTDWIGIRNEKRTIQSIQLYDSYTHTKKKKKKQFENYSKCIYSSNTWIYRKWKKEKKQKPIEIHSYCQALSWLKRAALKLNHRINVAL